MLTPIDIQSKVFKGGFGYDRKEVDAFMAEVIENYENLYKENVNLTKKIEALNTALAQYKSIEKSLQKALLLAQKTSDDIKMQAAASAKLIEKEAHNKAEQIMADSKAELAYVHRKTMALVQQYELYRTQFDQLARTQLALMQSDAFQLKISHMGDYVDGSLEESTEKEAVDVEAKPQTDAKEPETAPENAEDEKKED
jgi:cell division initiation protein